MLKFIIENFSHVFPILLSGMFALVIVVERTAALVWTYNIAGFEPFIERVKMLVLKDRITEAIALCESYRSKPAARVVREGLMRANQPEQLIEHGLEIAVGDALEKINLRTAFLGTIANIATLFGLLGTIVGLVQSFDAVGSANAQDRASLLAKGISVAMNATMLGLGVAIPAMIAFSLLTNRANRLTAQVDSSAVRIKDLLKQRFFKVDPKLDIDNHPHKGIRHR
ncbi:MAG: MotA/TolQ/ExbB proton channel family protein [Bdellovibrionales bacterium]|jgi:biopolymer transport protein ExbB|nr:MotA/TolQ/ExbB proton channel family protein [Bdellovibrionales bacterium]